VIVIDTSCLIDSLSGPRRSAATLRALIASGERIVTPTLVLYEWWRGPRLAEEIAAQEALFPRETALAFSAEAASVASNLYRAARRRRGRELDIAIAAVAIVNEAALWTLNPKDFDDLPGLAVVRA
jgi:predicted nucleic acid-binding protein